MEKLLRSCPNVKAIYVLIREKKGTPAPERLHSILAEKLFEHLQQNDPLCFNKVIERGKTAVDKSYCFASFVNRCYAYVIERPVEKL